MARETWSIRRDANLLYLIVPTAHLLVQGDHFIWIGYDPRSVGLTRMRLATMVPAERGKPDTYWKHNHDITLRTLQEDFDIGAGVQAGFASGANREHLFGRYEGALDVFNRTVEACLPA